MCTAEEVVAFVGYKRKKEVGGWKIRESHYPKGKKIYLYLQKGK